MSTEAEIGPKRGHERLYPTGFPIRCTDREKREIFTRAKRANRSASRFLVELATLAEGQLLAPRLSPEALAALEELAVQLRRVGTNLNQRARRTHDTAPTDTGPPADAEVAEATRAVTEVVQRIRERLA